MGQLLLASFCLALIVAVGGVLVPAAVTGAGPDGSGAKRPLLPAEWFALVLPLVGFLLTLPTKPPFSGGQGLGKGFLIGGIGALLCYFAARRSGGSPGMGATGVALPVATVAIPLLLLRPVLVDALMGVAIGWFAIAFLLSRVRPADDDEADASGPLIGAMGFAVALSAAAVLGTLRDPRTAALAKGTWSTLAVAFAAAGALLVLITAFLHRGSAGKRGPDLTVVIALGLAGLVALLIGTKAVTEMRFVAIVVIGILLWPLLRWQEIAAPGRLSQNAPLLSVLLVVSGIMVGGQLMQGYGAALLLVALYFGWAVSGQASAGRDAGVSGIRLLLFGTVLVLYRAFVARWSDDLHGVNLTDQYAIYGFVVGAVSVPYLTSLVAGVRPGKQDGVRPIVESTVACLFTLAVPTLVVLMFGPKCALALLVGCAVGGVIDISPRSATTLAAPRLDGAVIFAVGIGLALVQWCDRVLPYAELARMAKLKVLIFILGVLLVAVAASIGRRRDTDDTAASDGALS